MLFHCIHSLVPTSSHISVDVAFIPEGEVLDSAKGH